MAVIHGERKRVDVDGNVVERLREVGAQHGVPQNGLAARVLAAVLEDEVLLDRVLEGIAAEGRPKDPSGLPDAAARVYGALVASYTGLGPVRSQALADELQIHRGNVDRHLGLLRELGFARRDGRGHVPMMEADQEAPLAS
jgi:hypothetical protein